MSTIEKLLIMFILPVIGLLLYPLETIQSGYMMMAIIAVLILLLGVLLLRGRSLALTFAIFLQGMNVIVRLMMFLSHAVPANKPADIPYIVTNLIAMALSMWLLLRMDTQNFRVYMKT